MHETIETILERKENELEATIKQVDDRIRQGKNPDIKIKGSGENIHWHLPYRNDDETLDHPLYAQLPQMSIIDILTFVHQQTNCFSPFTHLLSRYGKQEVDIPRIIACIVAFGENIGIYKMAAISDVSLQDLITIGHDFIRLETLKPGDDLITNAMAKLPIFKHYNIEEEVIHGSIDGQKFNTQIDTINARHSPKYFGLGKGVTSRLSEKYLKSA